MDDARQAVEAGADALGFNFWPGSLRYVAVERAREIIEGLAGPVLKVGVFVDATAALVGFMINADKIGEAKFTAKYGRKK